MRLAVVKLLVVMALEVSDPEVMKQDRPETSRSKSCTQPASSPSMKTSAEMTLLNKGDKTSSLPPRSRNPSRDIKTLGPVTDTARNNCSSSFELTTLTALLLSLLLLHLSPCYSSIHTRVLCPTYHILLPFTSGDKCLP